CKHNCRSVGSKVGCCLPVGDKKMSVVAEKKHAEVIGLQNKEPKQEDKFNYTTPNRGNNNWRNNGNQVGMRNDNTPNNTGNNNNFKKSPWGRNTSMDGSNGNTSFTGTPNDGNQGSGMKGRDFKKSPWGRNSSFDNGGSPRFTGSPGDFHQGSGRKVLGQGRDFYITDKLKEISENLYDLEPRVETQRKFSNQARLWVGNIHSTTTEEELKELFNPYGEFDEFYFDKNKGFGFVRMDFKANAVKAQVELNKKNLNGRELKIRLSPTQGTALKVRNLSPHVTTELLEKVFEIFGELERVMVFRDERGNSTCEGVVEYCRKASVNMVMRKCQEGCLYLSASLRPVIVEQMPLVDEHEGLGEVNINKRETKYYDERHRGPRLPPVGSFEDEFGNKWKKLYETYDLKKKEIDDIMIEESRKLDMQMELAKHEHETEMLRRKLKDREEANYRQKMQFEQRMGGYGQPDNNLPKYEDRHFRQKEQNHTHPQNFAGQRWEDTHYDSLYNEPGGPHRGNLGGRPGGNNFVGDNQG
ncbi:unnamed protein product, partial [Meganyctiphanes norvegica]